MSWLRNTPLHILLRRYRVLQVAIIIFVAWQLYDFTDWYQTNYQTVQEWANAAVLGYFGTLAGILKFALDGVMKADLHDTPTRTHDDKTS